MRRCRRVMDAPDLCVTLCLHMVFVCCYFRCSDNILCYRWFISTALGVLLIEKIVIGV